MQPTKEELKAQLEMLKESNENWKDGFEIATRNLDAADIQIEELKQQNAELLQVIKDIQQWVRKDEISFETIIGAIDAITDQAMKATS